MNALANKVTLIGNVGNAPEFKSFDGGSKLLTFSLATSESWKDQKGEKKEETTWHNIVAWGKTAELMNQLTEKGSRLCIEGKIKNEKYTKDGETRYSSKIVVNEFMKLDPKKKD